VQGDLEAEEWRELSLDSVMANFIHMDAAVDTDSAEPEAMATVKVVDSDNTHISTCNIKPRFYLKRPKIPFGTKSCQET
jgi:hypothetical protein